MSFYITNLMSNNEDYLMETLNYCVSELSNQVHFTDAEFLVLFMVFWLVAAVLHNKFEMNTNEE